MRKKKSQIDNSSIKPSISTFTPLSFLSSILFVMSTTLAANPTTIHITKNMTDHITLDLTHTFGIFGCDDIKATTSFKNGGYDFNIKTLTPLPVKESVIPISDAKNPKFFNLKKSTINGINNIQCTLYPKAKDLTEVVGTVLHYELFNYDKDQLTESVLLQVTSFKNLKGETTDLVKNKASPRVFGMLNYIMTRDTDANKARYDQRQTDYWEKNKDMLFIVSRVIKDSWMMAEVFIQNIKLKFKLFDLSSPSSERLHKLIEINELDILTNEEDNSKKDLFASSNSTTGNTGIEQNYMFDILKKELQFLILGTFNQKDHQMLIYFRDRFFLVTNKDDLQKSLGISSSRLYFRAPVRKISYQMGKFLIFSVKNIPLDKVEINEHNRKEYEGKTSEPLNDQNYYLRLSVGQELNPLMLNEITSGDKEDRLKGLKIKDQDGFLEPLGQGKFLTSKYNAQNELEILEFIEKMKTDEKQGVSCVITSYFYSKVELRLKLYSRELIPGKDKKCLKADTFIRMYSLDFVFEAYDLESELIIYPRYYNTDLSQIFKLEAEILHIEVLDKLNMVVIKMANSKTFKYTAQRPKLFIDIFDGKKKKIDIVPKKTLSLLSNIASRRQDNIEKFQDSKNSVKASDKFTVDIICSKEGTKDTPYKLEVVTDMKRRKLGDKVRPIFDNITKDFEKMNLSSGIDMRYKIPDSLPFNFLEVTIRSSNIVAYGSKNITEKDMQRTTMRDWLANYFQKETTAFRREKFKLSLHKSNINTPVFFEIDKNSKISRSMLIDFKLDTTLVFKEKDGEFKFNKEGIDSREINDVQMLDYNDVLMDISKNIYSMQLDTLEEKPLTGVGSFCSAIFKVRLGTIPELFVCLKQSEIHAHYIEERIKPKQTPIKITYDRSKLEQTLKSYTIREVLSSTHLPQLAILVLEKMDSTTNSKTVQFSFLRMSYQGALRIEMLDNSDIEPNRFLTYFPDYQKNSQDSSSKMSNDQKAKFEARKIDKLENLLSQKNQTIGKDNKTTIWYYDISKYMPDLNPVNSTNYFTSDLQFKIVDKNIVIINRYKCETKTSKIMYFWRYQVYQIDSFVKLNSQRYRGTEKEEKKKDSTDSGQPNNSSGGNSKSGEELEDERYKLIEDKAQYDESVQLTLVKDVSLHDFLPAKIQSTINEKIETYFIKYDIPTNKFHLLQLLDDKRQRQQTVNSQEAFYQENLVFKMQTSCIEEQEDAESKNSNCTLEATGDPYPTFQNVILFDHSKPVQSTFRPLLSSFLFEELNIGPALVSRENHIERSLVMVGIRSKIFDRFDVEKHNEKKQHRGGIDSNWKKSKDPNQKKDYEVFILENIEPQIRSDLISTISEFEIQKKVSKLSSPTTKGSTSNNQTSKNKSESLKKFSSESTDNKYNAKQLETLKIYAPEENYSLFTLYSKIYCLENDRELKNLPEYSKIQSHLDFLKDIEFEEKLVINHNRTFEYLQLTPKTLEKSKKKYDIQLSQSGSQLDYVTSLFKTSPVVSKKKEVQTFFEGPISSTQIECQSHIECRDEIIQVSNSLRKLEGSNEIFDFKLEHPSDLGSKGAQNLAERTTRFFIEKTKKAAKVVSVTSTESIITRRGESDADRKKKEKEKELERQAKILRNSLSPQNHVLYRENTGKMKDLNLKMELFSIQYYVYPTKASISNKDQLNLSGGGSGNDVRKTGMFQYLIAASESRVIHYELYSNKQQQERLWIKPLKNLVSDCSNFVKVGTYMVVLCRMGSVVNHLTLFDLSKPNTMKWFDIRVAFASNHVYSTGEIHVEVMEHMLFFKVKNPATQMIESVIIMRFQDLDDDTTVPDYKERLNYPLLKENTGTSEDKCDNPSFRNELKKSVVFTILKEMPVQALDIKFLHAKKSKDYYMAMIQSKEDNNAKDCDMSVMIYKLEIDKSRDSCEPLIHVPGAFSQEVKDPKSTTNATITNKTDHLQFDICHNLNNSRDYLLKGVSLQTFRAFYNNYIVVEGDPKGKTEVSSTAESKQLKNSKFQETSIFSNKRGSRKPNYKNRMRGGQNTARMQDSSKNVISQDRIPPFILHFPNAHDYLVQVTPSGTLTSKEISNPFFGIRTSLSFSPKPIINDPFVPSGSTPLKYKEYILVKNYPNGKSQLRAYKLLDFEVSEYTKGKETKINLFESDSLKARKDSKRVFFTFMTSQFDQHFSKISIIPHCQATLEAKDSSKKTEESGWRKCPKGTDESRDEVGLALIGKNLKIYKQIISSQLSFNFWNRYLASGSLNLKSIGVMMDTEVKITLTPRNDNPLLRILLSFIQIVIICVFGLFVVIMMVFCRKTVGDPSRRTTYAMNQRTDSELDSLSKSMAQDIEGVMDHEEVSEYRRKHMEEASEQQESNFDISEFGYDSDVQDKSKKNQKIQHSVYLGTGQGDAMEGRILISDDEDSDDNNQNKNFKKSLGSNQYPNISINSGLENGGTTKSNLLGNGKNRLGNDFIAEEEHEDGSDTESEDEDLLSHDVADESEDEGQRKTILKLETNNLPTSNVESGSLEKSKDSMGEGTGVGLMPGMGDKDFKTQSMAVMNESMLISEVEKDSSSKKGKSQKKEQVVSQLIDDSPDTQVQSQMLDEEDEGKNLGVKEAKQAPTLAKSEFDIEDQGKEQVAEDQNKKLEEAVKTNNPKKEGNIDSDASNDSDEEEESDDEDFDII